MHGKKHPTKNSHSQSWSPWSEWKWSKEHSRYYSERFDRQGNVEYAWDNNAPAVNEHQRTPRTEAPIEPSIEQLTTGFGGLDVRSAAYAHDQGVAYPNQSALPVDNPTTDLPPSPRYTHDTVYNSHHGYSHSHKDKGKGIASAASHNAPYDDGHGYIGTVPATTNSYNQQPYPEHSHSSSISGSGDTNNSYYPPQSRVHDETDYELERALQNSRDELLGNSRGGGSSSSGAHYGSSSVHPGTYELNSTGFPDDDKTIRGNSVPSIRGTPGTMEMYDSRFVVEQSFKFQPGEVFKILWSEPTGQVAGDASISDLRTIHDTNGHFYIGYRRFIIVTTDDSHHSTCVPILTYDRRGCNKKGVKPNKHGIIYAVGQKPKLLKHEPELGFDPVPLEIYAEGETLARESRVNYSKLVTIEHNVKVFFIGRIPNSYFDNVSYAVDKCWNDKMHGKNKKSRR
ncbi:hypothetical protein HD806DRAFT_549381 [Xylariaceae sp. AK1471]|nr:hypothetical protein HD806DRAFT_549381 [Xylariaceae sp. AK1471]